MMLDNVRVWFEWVDSDSNPADGLSRDGILDSWSIAQGWDLAEAPVIDWRAVFSLLDLP